MNIDSHLEFQFSSPLPIIVKKLEYWPSKAAITPNAIEGDPTLFMRAFGLEIAEYFGFRFLDNNTLQVPNVRHFQSQVTLLNEQLSVQNRIGLSFYETDETVESPESYLRRFVKEISLPIAAIGTVAIHDTTFHYGGIFFPQVCLISGILQTEAILDFADSLSNEHQALKQHLFAEAALNIDSALGNFSSHYLNRPENQNAFWILSREGYNAKGYLSWFTKTICQKYQLPVPLKELDAMTARLNGKHQLNLSMSAEVFYRLCDHQVQAVKDVISRI